MTWTGLRDRAFAVLGAVLLLIALPVASFALRSVGPAERVVFYEYLPLVEFGMYLFAAALGAAVGWDAARWLRARSVARRLPYVRLAGLALLGCWVVLPQLLAFPASASVAERDAWARSRLRQYAALTRVVAAIPQVQADVGKVVAMAPTANDQHVGAMTRDEQLSFLRVLSEPAPPPAPEPSAFGSSGYPANRAHTIARAQHRDLHSSAFFSSKHGPNSPELCSPYATQACVHSVDVTTAVGPPC